ncbi:MAG TPA: hypothetical protein VHE35_36230, partial [Kofleriaceae bacterium]|nr:hypothetical protein [Kofleriaceae bacterium]
MAERLFNVVIEHPRAPGPEAVATLAQAIAARYGIPAADLERRIARGRFRVKSKVDRSTADTYAADLTRLGAVCVVLPVEESTTQSMPAVSGPIDVQGMALPESHRDPAPRPLTDRAGRVSTS